MKKAQTHSFANLHANISLVIYIFVFTIVISSLATRVQAANNGLILHLNFEETSGSVANDSSGSSNNGSVTSESLRDTSGKIGGAITFDGASSLSVNKINVSDFSISTWIKTSANTARGDIALQFDGSSDGFSGFGLVLNPGFGSCTNGGVIGLWVGDLTDAYICTTSGVADGQWHLVTATWDNSFKIGRIFIDGNETAKESRSSSSITSKIENMIFAKNPYSGDYFTGSLDDIRIYDHALSSSDIQKIYDITKPTITINGSNPLVLTLNKKSRLKGDKSLFNLELQGIFG